MLALLKTGSSVALRTVPDPVPLSHEAIVRVNTFALNRRELLNLAELPDGSPTGSDFAGTLVEYPAVITETAKMTAARGTRVVGTVRRGAWAELVAVPYTRLALIPDAVSDVQACTLPTPGLAALRSLEHGGFLVGKQVLVTGARGSVGRLACQLAQLAGAHVVALVRPEERADLVPGAERVEGRLLGHYDLVIDTVGGEVLGEAIESLEPRGVLVAVATPDRHGQVSFRAKRADRSAGARIQFLDDLDEVTAHDSIHTDLKRLVELVAGVKLDVGVGVEEPWQNAAAVIQGVLENRIEGRVVLRVRDAD